MLQKLHIQKRASIALSLVGNAFEHFDHVLYYLLAPFIAPLFYAKVSYVFALTLAVLPVDLIFRPLAVIFFSWISRKIGIHSILLISLFGMGTCALCIGLLPSYQLIGVSAPILLTCLRGLTSFFATGEATAAPLYLFHQTHHKKHVWYSSIYEVSSSLGMFIASLLISWLLWRNILLEYWRLLYLFGALASLIGFLLRYLQSESLEIKSRAPLFNFCSLRKMLPSIFLIAVVTGFLCVNCNFIFYLVNGLLPVMTSLNLNQMMFIHTGLALFDMLLFPCFGWLSYRIGVEKMMLICIAIIVTSVFPLYRWVLSFPNMYTLVLFRFILMICGVGCSAPYQKYIQKQTQYYSFFELSLGKNLGKLLLSSPFMWTSYLIFEMTGWRYLPCVYVFILGILAFSGMWLRFNTSEKMVESASF